MLNSPLFIAQLEEMSGIHSLIPDKSLYGGGIHSISRGGFLKIHADFNWHEEMQVHRRMNLLLYLNSEWDHRWGSALELWNKDMTKKVQEVMPVSNRLVIFNTSDFSFHGHPDPLKCPPSRQRLSIALYYYSKSRPAHEVEHGKSRQTAYQRRPNGD
jgi:Rps23 Pro-64 3,4-dihydroxylase Tpa1-like proline 4-hydroxylase